MSELPQYKDSFTETNRWSTVYQGYIFSIIEDVYIEIENKKSLDIYQINKTVCKTGINSLNKFISALKCALTGQKDQFFNFTLELDEIPEENMAIRFTYTNNYINNIENFILKSIHREKEDKIYRRAQISINECESDFKSKLKQIENHQGINEIKVEISNLKDDLYKNIEQINTDYNILKNRTDHNDNNIGELNAELFDVQTTINAHQATINANQVTINGLSAKVHKIETDFDILKTKSEANLLALKTKLEADLNELKSRIDKLDVAK